MEKHQCKEQKKHFVKKFQSFLAVHFYKVLTFLISLKRKKYLLFSTLRAFHSCLVKLPHHREVLELHWGTVNNLIDNRIESFDFLLVFQHNFLDRLKRNWLFPLETIVSWPLDFLRKLVISILHQSNGKEKDVQAYGSFEM